MNTLIKSVSTVALAMALSACGSTPAVVEEQQQNHQTNQFYLTAKADVEQLTQLMAKAKQDNLEYYAPDALEEAQDQLEDAVDEFDDIRFEPEQADADIAADIHQCLLDAQVQLEQAYLIKGTADKVLAESFSMMARLDELNAAQFYKKEVRRAKSDLHDLVEDIADGDIEDAREDQPKLVKLMFAIEVNTVETVNLSSHKRALAVQKRNRVNRVVPLSFQKALASIESAKSIIASNPRADDEIAIAVAQVRFDLEHSAHIALEVTRMDDLSSDELEQAVLLIENQLHRIGKALGSSDIRDLPLAQQAQILAEKSAELLQEKQELVAQLAASQAESKLVQLPVALNPSVPSAVDVPVETEQVEANGSAEEYPAN